MDHFRNKFHRFMAGRYGTDELNRFLSMIILILIVIHIFVRSGIFFWLEMLCVIVIYARTFSKNTGRRFRENQTYLNCCFHVAEWVRNGGYRWRQRRKFKIFKCPHCGQRLRIPRGHGKIQIHCKKCGQDFMGRS